MSQRERGMRAMASPAAGAAGCPARAGDRAELPVMTSTRPDTVNQGLTLVHVSAQRKRFYVTRDALGGCLGGV